MTVWGERLLSNPEIGPLGTAVGLFLFAAGGISFAAFSARELGEVLESNPLSLNALVSVASFIVVPIGGLLPETLENLFDIRDISNTVLECFKIVYRGELIYFGASVPRYCSSIGGTANPTI